MFIYVARLAIVLKKRRFENLEKERQTDRYGRKRERKVNILRKGKSFICFKILRIVIKAFS
jgi:hypothetical protein